MPFTVYLTDHAETDLNELYDYIVLNDGTVKADFVISKIEEVLLSLSEFPERGAYPKELLSIGIHEYREVFFKPYRIIYRIIKKKVYVLLIADGRRDMASFLQRRLLM